MALAFSLVLALVLPAQAAQSMVGIILTGDIPYYQDMNRAFLEQLQREGFSGKFEIVTQTPAPDPVSWSNAARKMVALDVNMIVVYGAPAALAVSRETSSIPIVFAGVSEPRVLGLNGKNITGISSKFQLAGLIKNLKSIKDFSRLGIIYNTMEKDTIVQADEVARMQGQFGFKAVKMSIKSRTDAEKLHGVDALFITTSCTANQCIAGIAKVVRSLNIPACTTVSGGEAAGILMSVYASPQEQGARAAEIAARVLKGARPSSIRVEGPHKIEMTLNLREARELGLRIPLDILSSATKIIK